MYLKSVKCRIYPTKEQQVLINKTLGCMRWMYNHMLGRMITAYQSDVKISYRDLQDNFKVLKKQEDTKWLAEVDSQGFYQELENLKSAYNGFFKSGKGFPKFKKKKNRNTYTCPNPTAIKGLDWQKGLLHMPKLPNIKIVLTQEPVDGKIKRVTLERTPSGKYFASILIEVNQELPKPKNPENVCGIDVGLIDYVVMSNGAKVKNPKNYRKALQRLKVMQRRHARKVKGSANREKSRIKLAKQHEKVTNQRKDFLHKLSYRIVKDNQFDTVAVESLTITGMVKNHKLAMSISDASWGKFFNMLEYKCLWYGKNFVKLDKFERSTHECNNCGHVPDKMSLSIRGWICGECGSEHDRDLNAAYVIANKGLKKLREAVSRRSCGDADSGQVCEAGSLTIFNG